MVIETLVVTAIATAMLGWNVHVMSKSGVCCPPERGATTAAPGSSAQAATAGQSSLRWRRRGTSSRRKAMDQGVVWAAGGGVAPGKMASIAESTRAPVADLGAVGTINGDGDAIVVGA